jgi:hypothetical protein
LPEACEVRLEAVEDEPVAFGEIPPAATVEQERLRVPEGGRNRDVELVLATEGPEPDVVEPRLVQLAGREEVRELERADEPLLMTEAHRVRLDDEVPEQRPRLIAAVIFVPRSGDGQEMPPPHAVQLAVGDPVRMDELPELGKQLPREWLVSAEALCLGDEPQQVLRVASTQRRQGTQRYDEWRMYSTPRLGELVSSARQCVRYARERRAARRVVRSCGKATRGE